MSAPGQTGDILQSRDSDRHFRSRSSSAPIDNCFIAQLLGLWLDMPQSRLRRRADPEEMARAYHDATLAAEPHGAVTIVRIV